jgi:type I restriction enzyme M protein
VEEGYVDCVVQLTGQLFANTKIPCALWFLSKSRNGEGGFRKRRDEILFIDGRKLGALIPGSRKQKQLTEEEIERVAGAYREFRRKGAPAAVPGLYRVATIEEVRDHGYALTPGRYVGSTVGMEEDAPFEERFGMLASALDRQFDEAIALADRIRRQLSQLTIDD